MSGSARALFSDFIRSKEKSLTISSLIEELKEIPKGVDDVFFRFATFTAKPGSSVVVQVEKYRSSHRFGSEAAGGLGRRTKFPKITDDTLRSELADEPDVPGGFIRQYFCYVTEKNVGRIAAVVEMPDKHFDTSFAKAGLKTQFHMRREAKFHLISLENYSKELIRDHQELTSSTEDAIFTGSSGKLQIAGMEMFLHSASDSESRGGFLLVSPSWGQNEIKYCPNCIDELVEQFQNGNRRVIHPPIPKTALKLTSYCPERTHEVVDEDECISFADLTRKMNAARTELGLPHIEIVELEFPSSTDDPIPSWIDVSGELH